VASNKGLIDDPRAEPLVRGVGVEYFIQVVEHQRYGHGGDDSDARATARVTSPRPGFNSAWNSIGMLLVDAR
jgi:hypothetical protein